MSNYRDDSHEIMVASNSVLDLAIGVTVDSAMIADTSKAIISLIVADSAKIADDSTNVLLQLVEDDAVLIVDNAIIHFSQLMEDGAVISDDVLSYKIANDFVKETINVQDKVQANKNISVLITDALAISEQFTEKTIALISDTIQINSQVTQLIQRTQIITEQRKITDIISTIAVTTHLFQDQLITIDAVLDQQSSSTISDQVQIKSEVFSFNQASILVENKAKIADKNLFVYSEYIEDDLYVVDAANEQTRISELIVDQVPISDVLQSQIVFSQKITDQLIIRDVTQGSLIANQTIHDYFFIDDLILNQPLSGYAWTSNADNWAMSRYDGFNYSDLAVVDGVLYGVAEDGLYRLNARNHVEGKLTTGKIDLGRGQLIHPLAAYLEYELFGNSKALQVAITTTQSGSEQTYNYVLPTEKADYLTNGRVLFGRGLRGRHFKFEIKISGEHGYINDLNIDVAATKRRV
ncbi:hypothetical protein [Acinetobacter sp. ANC 4204]|uniref:hypothetical protein n=1 Tax=Acinetobacter sp. ANC 4204 TaxID=1977884 RepID=UPI00111C2E65|nr:hypothetical protein [Acinetobacter sp. ANC 4204]